MKIKSPAKWLDLKEYTEINHIQFLLRCIQEADIEDEEESMLDQAFNVTKVSRLSCQIEYNDRFSGAIFTIAPE